MDISVSGVKGYDFQYKATLLISLQLLKKDYEFKIFVEPFNGEDFLIILNDNQTKIEVQVKREISKLNEKKLNEWLCHFESHNFENCLLSRLINTENYALFLTRSRCLDSTSFLIQKKEEIIIHENYLSTDSHHLSFYNNLKKSNFFKPTKLGIKRNTFCNEIAKKIEKKTDFDNIFKKILIVENLSDESVDEQILLLLSSSFQISYSRLYIVYLLLLDSIKKARDSKKDWVNSIIEILNKNKVNSPKLNQNYIQRGIEQSLISKIDTEHILLLTGISLCGKTELAKQIANSYINKGYSYNIASDFLSAESFFFAVNPDDDKILILEDPFGHIELIHEVAIYKLKLENLINNLHDNHKLIVTSRKEIIDDIYKNLELIAFKKLFWIDLTINDQNEAIFLWNEISSLLSYSDDVCKKINCVIELKDNSETLQIGQIQYLSKFDKTDILLKDIDELETIARQNSNDVAIYIVKKNVDLGLLLSILSFCGNTISNIPLIDLEYIFGNDKTKYTVLENRLQALKDERPITFEYKLRKKLKADYKDFLTELEDRGFIIKKNKTFLFSHPNYYEAGRYIFKNFKRSKQHLFLKFFIKSVACNNEQIAFFATQQLTFLYENSITKHIKKKIVKIAFKALLSIFPSVIDNCLIFLLSIIEELKDKQKEKLIHNTAHNNVSLYDLEWHNDTPYETHNPRVMSKRFSFSILSIEEATNIEKDFLNNQSVLIKETWDLLLYYQNNKKHISKEIYEKLMFNKLSFVRAKASYLFFRFSINNPDLNELIENSFKDEHPSVVFNCLRGSLSSWYNYSKDYKAIIQPLLESSLQRKDISIRASSLITTFGIDYATEGIKLDHLSENQKIEIWKLWSLLFKIFLKVVPSTIKLHTPRFISTLNDAMKYLNKQEYIEVLNSWYASIILRIEKTGRLDSFEFSIAKNLLDCTKEDHSPRKELFDKLISYEYTSFLVVSLRWFLSEWDILSDYEKNKIFELVNGSRVDSRWMKAIVLTSYKVPDEFLELLLGQRDYFDKDLHEIVNNFDPQLLIDCISVYHGNPYILSNVSTKSNNFSIWQNINAYILENNYPIGYEMCLTEFLFDGVNGFNDKEKSIALWRKICTNSKDKNIETNELIYATASCSCNIESAKELWSILIKSYETENRKSEIISKIKENIIILQYSEREGIFDIIHKNILLTVLKETHPDNELITTLATLQTNPDINSENLILNLIENSTLNPFKFYNTILYAKKIADKLNINNELKQKLKVLPNEIFELGQPLIEKLNDTHNYKVDGWLF